MEAIHKFKVVKIIDETWDTKSFILEALEVPITFKQGQFVKWHTYNPDGTIDHTAPFSIASSKTDGKMIELTAKIKGVMTHEVFAFKGGETVGLEGPYGLFIFEESMKDVVFIAGGVGVTPLMGMIRYANKRKLDNKILMLYANKTPHDIIYREEIDQINATNPNIKVVYFVESLVNEKMDCVEGRISPEYLKTVITPERYFFICGPPPMVNAMVEMLKGLGVNEEKIKVERF